LVTLTYGASESGFSSGTLTLTRHVITWQSSGAPAFATTTVTIVTDDARCNHSETCIDILLIHFIDCVTAFCLFYYLF